MAARLWQPHQELQFPHLENRMTIPDTVKALEITSGKKQLKLKPQKKYIVSSHWKS